MIIVRDRNENMNELIIYIKLLYKSTNDYTNISEHTDRNIWNQLIIYVCIYMNEYICTYIYIYIYN